MNEDSTLADRRRDTAPAPHAPQTPDRRPWIAAVLHRWPTWLAIAMAAVLAPGAGSMP